MSNVRFLMEQVGAAEARIVELELEGSGRAEKIYGLLRENREQAVRIAELEAQVAEQSATIERLTGIVRDYRSGHAFCIADERMRDEELYDHAPCEWCVRADAALNPQPSKPSDFTSESMVQPQEKP